MMERLLHRAKTSGRADDNEQTIKNRLETFVRATEPVIEYYKKQNKVKQINSELPVDDVFEQVDGVMQEILPRDN